MSDKPDAAGFPAVPPEIFDHVEQQRVAADAPVALDTLRRALRGLPVRPSSMHRIRAALAKRGLLDVLPPQPVIPPSRGRP